MRRRKERFFVADPSGEEKEAFPAISGYFSSILRLKSSTSLGCLLKGRIDAGRQQMRFLFDFIPLQYFKNFRRGSDDRVRALCHVPDDMPGDAPEQDFRHIGDVICGVVLPERMKGIYDGEIMQFRAVKTEFPYHEFGVDMDNIGIKGVELFGHPKPFMELSQTVFRDIGKG